MKNWNKMCICNGVFYIVRMTALIAWASKLVSNGKISSNRAMRSLLAALADIFEPLKNYVVIEHNYLVNEYLIVLNDFVK